MKSFWRWAGLALLAFVCPNVEGQMYYVSYGTGNTVEEFGADGSDLGAFATGLNGAMGMAVDAQGNLYVVNNGANTIEKLSPMGQDLGPFATKGLNQPIGIATDSAGNFYVANSVNLSIEKFSPSGADLGVFAQIGTQPWEQPWGLLFDSGGNLVVSSAINSTVQRFSPTGVSLAPFITSNLVSSTGMGFDNSGNLYVAYEGNGVVEKYSTTGTDLGAVASGLGSPNGLLVDGSGNFLVCCPIRSPFPNFIQKYSSAGSNVTVFANTGLKNPYFIIPVATPIVTQPVPATLTGGSNATLSVAVNGTVLNYQWQKNGVNLVNGGKISGADAATLQITGALGADAGNYRVLVTTAANTFPSVTVPLVVMAAPTSAQVYYVSYANSNRVEEFSSSGVDLGIFASGVTGPQGLAFDTTGNLYVAESKLIEKFSPTGTDLGQVVVADNPEGLAFDSSGYLYVAMVGIGNGDPEANSVHRITPGGVDLWTFVNTGIQPWGLLFDSGGNLFVSETAMNTVQRFSPKGTVLPFAAAPSYDSGFPESNLNGPTGLA
jgi:sugar lactone lactonase YvrE